MASFAGRLINVLLSLYVNAMVILVSKHCCMHLTIERCHLSPVPISSLSCSHSAFPCRGSVRSCKFCLAAVCRASGRASCLRCESSPRSLAPETKQAVPTCFCRGEGWGSCLAISKISFERKCVRVTQEDGLRFAMQQFHYEHPLTLKNQLRLSKFLESRHLLIASFSSTAHII